MILYSPLVLRIRLIMATIPVYRDNGNPLAMQPVLLLPTAINATVTVHTVLKYKIPFGNKRKWATGHIGCSCRTGEGDIDSILAVIYLNVDPL